MKLLVATTVALSALILIVVAAGSTKRAAGVFRYKSMACLTFPARQNYYDPSIVCDLSSGPGYVTSGYAVGVNRSYVWVIDIKANKIVFLRKQSPRTTAPLYP